MSATWKKGDSVAWGTPQGETHGTVVRVLHKREHIDGHTFDASPSDPRYEVESAKTGKRAVHAGDALKAVKGKG